MSVARHQTHERGGDILFVKLHEHFSIESGCHSPPLEVLIVTPHDLYLGSVA